MSRYYEISVTPIGSPKPIKIWTSELSGVFDPQAQNVTFDIYEYNYAIPAGGSTISIEGITLGDIGQSKSYTGMTIQVKGGMKKGLPLANPKQAGTLVTGQVFQSFGNWEGTEMSLDFVLLASPFTYEMPGNFSFNWKKGTPLSGALLAMFNAAYPGSPSIVIDISPSRVASSDHVFIHHSLEQAAQSILSLTKGKLDPTDAGVQISINGAQGIYAYDYTQASNPIDLSFNDFVGQPVWIKPYEIQLKLVMRGDLSVGTLIRMPKYQKSPLPSVPGIVTTLEPSLPSYTKQNIVFQGNFFVSKLRHVGNFRDPNGASWVTIVNAITSGSLIGT